MQASLRKCTALLVLCLSLQFTLHNAIASEKYTGKAAPEFTLKQLDGKPVSLKQLRANGHVMLIFWEPNCVYCYSHINDFNALHEKYNGKGLTIAAINFLGEYEAEIREYVTGNNVKYMVLADRLNGIDVAQAYKVFGSPTIVVISPAGKILFYGHKIPDVEQWL